MNDEIKPSEEITEEKTNSETIIDNEQNDDIQAAEEKRNNRNTAVLLKEKRELSVPMTDDEAKKNMASRTRRTFLIGGATALLGIFGWRSMSDESKNALLNRTFRFNERFSQIFFDKNDLAPEFSKNQLTEARVNGSFGLSEDIDAANWRLRVGGLANRSDDLILTLDDVKALPRTEMTVELKCIEGWSIVVNWAGARFSDFAAKYLPKTRSGQTPDLINRPQDLVRYVSLITPDEEYYVGWDMPSILHPQTLLAYEMNGAPLLPEHGAPLRLATATKYGIKQIKRIGRIEFSDERPADYWAEQGYDWYSGH
ncbi:MAG: molybdopterin-dependent oxidoreductase [Pyrinomonadaceae bacterium]